MCQVNRRIAKIKPDPVNEGKYVRTDFYYTPLWQIAQTREKNDLASKDTVATTRKYEYVWDVRYIDAPILRDRDAGEGGNLGQTGSGLDERLYYLTDANMNVTCLVDTGGDAVERYVYDPYGKVTIYDDDWSETRNSSSFDNAILYCGYYHDWETGLYHVRFRYYHVTIGRWLTRDPLGYADGMSLYEYVRRSPPRYVDRNGAQAAEPAPRPAKPAPPPKPQYGLIVPDAGLRTALMNLMAKMCPCFDYKEEGKDNVRIAIVDKFKPDGDKPSRDFCCCYYKHLPACNLLLVYRDRGGYPGSLYPQKQDFPTSRGAAWRNKRGRHHVEMGVKETGDTFAHEMTHGVFGLEWRDETAVDAGVALIQGKPGSYGRKRLTRKTAIAIARMLKELATDNAGCNRRPEFGEKPTDVTPQTQQAMNQFKEFQRQAQSIVDKVEVIPERVR